MNSTKKRMLEVLRELKSEYGIRAIKAEFEAEGSRLDELIMLNEVVYRADLDVIIKIGGCEAVRDLDQAKLLGAGGIMAPMIETPYAMKKFVNSANKVYGEEVNEIEWIINTETITCLENFDDILEAGKDFVDTIAIGRVDLSGSIGLGRSEINGEKVFELASSFAKKAKERNIRVGVGGGISFEAIPFLMRLSGLIDRFETRKVVFDFTLNEAQMKKGILLAMEFEMLYLQNKCDFYGRMASEDADRVVMLKKRYERSLELL